MLNARRQFYRDIRPPPLVGSASHLKLQRRATRTAAALARCEPHRLFPAACKTQVRTRVNPDMWQSPQMASNLDAIETSSQPHPPQCTMVMNDESGMRSLAVAVSISATCPGSPLTRCAARVGCTYWVPIKCPAVGLNIARLKVI